LAVCSGHLDLTAEHAAALGTPPDLFRIVQLAVTLAQAHGVPCRLSVGAPAEENLVALGLEGATPESLAHEIDRCFEPGAEEKRTWEAPAQTPLLRELLLTEVEKRRLCLAPALSALEADIDHLHDALNLQHHTEETRLQLLKLRALAEFAAGAGHEINNPLAVISGRAQYLLSHEPDPSRQRSLQTIIGQAKRIHDILSELMQFARPIRPKRQRLDVSAATQEVINTLAELATARCVRVLFTPLPQPLSLYADPRQIQTALQCLLRNAIEAAPAEGWSRIQIEMPETDRITWIVEDNGGGPTPIQQEHLFDPFYSGRQAGRGRGLGLPTAWQLARNHDGEVRYEGAIDGTTRFVLSLPLTPVPAEEDSPEKSPLLRTPENALLPHLPLAESLGNGVDH
jgi:signal transduction histidine kinase